MRREQVGRKVRKTTSRTSHYKPLTWVMVSLQKKCSCKNPQSLSGFSRNNLQQKLLKKKYIIIFVCVFARIFFKDMKIWDWIRANCWEFIGQHWNGLQVLSVSLSLSPFLSALMIIGVWWMSTQVRGRKSWRITRLNTMMTCFIREITLTLVFSSLHHKSSSTCWELRGILIVPIVPGIIMFEGTL